MLVCQSIVMSQYKIAIVFICVGEVLVINFTPIHSITYTYELDTQTEIVAL